MHPDGRVCQSECSDHDLPRSTPKRSSRRSSFSSAAIMRAGPYRQKEF